MKKWTVRFRRPVFVILQVGAFFLPCMTTAQTYLEGRVTCAQNGLPLDSVRVSSAFYTTITWTGSDGRFFLESNDGKNCLPETLIVDSYDEYMVRVTRTDRPHPFQWEENDPISITLFDLHGRVVKHAAGEKSFIRFPERKLPAGMYILDITGPEIKLKTKRVLVIDNGCRGYIDKKRHIIPSIIQPACPAADTIYFCREDYVVFSGPVNEIRNLPSVTLVKKQWVASDIHNHTVLTDGSFIQDSLLVHAFGEGGLDVYVNSEHGGAFYRDTADRYIVDDPYQNLAAPRAQFGGVYIPRWYTITEYSWPKLLGQRKKYPDKIILQGLEWNCPGHEHASVGFIDDADQPRAIAEFEYQFDFNDYDTSIPQLPKNNAYEHANSIAALTWLKDNFPASSYFFVNHPSREAIGPYSVGDMRDFHNCAPEVGLGFEGMPGHQKNPLRGSYGRTGLPRNCTWGGADYILSRVGGIWDALLGEGRHYWTIVNSDFHTTIADFWPGEYAKTWSTVTDTGARAWLEGMRCGEIFIVHGDLISTLDFSLDDGIGIAPMGADLPARKSELALTIRFKSPSVNNHGDSVRVDHIDLIGGSIIGKVNPSDREAYTNPVNPTTKVLRRFTAADWRIEGNLQVIRTTITCTRPTYYRLRGTNLKVGSPGEVDDQGNPLMDENYMNTEAIAWNDLWFYSNPIFVYIGSR
ncbi:MAG: T9SS type A sorting domain-containing protein [Chitinispirillaceae bacterium]|nr:T9SS type A sorting domain-containing protein [Chitinispirillaceae bacterium]